MQRKVQSKLVCLIGGQGNLCRIESVIDRRPSQVLRPVEFSMRRPPPRENGGSLGELCGRQRVYSTGLGGPPPMDVSIRNLLLVGRILDVGGAVPAVLQCQRPM